MEEPIRIEGVKKEARCSGCNKLIGKYAGKNFVLEHKCKCGTTTTIISQSALSASGKV